jgi:hypothetical protein
MPEYFADFKKNSVGISAISGPEFRLFRDSLWLLNGYSTVKNNILRNKSLEHEFFSNEL